MTTEKVNLPEVVTPEQWLSARKELLKKEKELTHHRDQVNAERRRLPMVKIDKDYIFESAEGSINFTGLFADHQQLIVYHFMFDPAWNEGCPGCSFIADNIGNLAHLYARNATLVLVSRAPVAKIEAYKKRLGWDIPWFSSLNSDFNYDFHVTIDEKKGSAEYNYKQKLGRMERRTTRNKCFSQRRNRSLSYLFGVCPWPGTADGYT
jgi:predicted dithiol-disulfide oxidoreductase (DUF899 family)